MSFVRVKKDFFAAPSSGAFSAPAFQSKYPFPAYTDGTPVPMGRLVPGNSGHVQILSYADRITGLEGEISAGAIVVGENGSIAKTTLTSGVNRATVQSYPDPLNPEIDLADTDPGDPRRLNPESPRGRNTQKLIDEMMERSPTESRWKQRQNQLKSNGRSTPSSNPCGSTIIKLAGAGMAAAGATLDSNGPIQNPNAFIESTIRPFEHGAKLETAIKYGRPTQVMTVDEYYGRFNPLGMIYRAIGQGSREVRIYNLSNVLPGT